MKKLEEKFIEILEEQELNGDEETIKQCAIIAEQECIGFAEWLSENQWLKKTSTHPNKVGRYYSHIYCEYKSIEDLFQLYLKSKENEY